MPIENSQDPFIAILDTFSKNPNKELIDEALELAKISNIDISATVSSLSQNSLLHLLIYNNADGLYNDAILEVIKLKPSLLSQTDVNERTPLQALIDFYEQSLKNPTPIELDSFKNTAMLLAMNGADFTLAGIRFTRPTLMHILVRENINGRNNKEILDLVRANPLALNVKDADNYNALEALPMSLVGNPSNNSSIMHFPHTFQYTIDALKKLDLSYNQGSPFHYFLFNLLTKNETGSQNTLIALMRTPDALFNFAVKTLIDNFSSNKLTYNQFKNSALALDPSGSLLLNPLPIKGGPTPLHWLVQNNENGRNDAAIVDLIKSNPDSLKQLDNQQCTPLHSLLFLIDNNQHIPGRRFKQKISEQDFKHTAMLLAKNGADIKTPTNFGSKTTLLHELARKGADTEITSLLEQDSNLKNEVDRYGRTPIFYYIWEHQWLELEKIQKIFSIDNLHETHNAKNDLLGIACFAGHSSLVKYFLEKLDQKTIEESNTSNSLLLHSAVYSKSRDILKWLIDKKMDINQKDSSGETALFYATACQNEWAVNYLIENQANLNIANNWGETPLSIAIQKVNLPLVKKLLINDANICIKAPGGGTLLHHAVKIANKEILELLLNYKSLKADQQIDINAKDEAGNTALHYAVLIGDKKAAQLLINYGADITVTNNTEKTPASMALSTNRADLLPTLIDVTQLNASIDAMHDYGEHLRLKKVAKGDNAIALAKQLRNLTTHFISQQPGPLGFDEYQKEFLTILHSKDAQMSSYRANWSTITKNIAIALTGVGLLFIAGQLIQSKLNDKRALFFFQNKTTTGEKRVEDIQQEFNKIDPTPKGP